MSSGVFEPQVLEPEDFEPEDSKAPGGPSLGRGDPRGTWGDRTARGWPVRHLDHLKFPFTRQFLRLWKRLGADAFPLVLLTSIPLAVFCIPALAGHPVWPGDDLTQNEPLRALVGAQLRAGHLPVYDPYIWSGAPLLAGWNAGAAYPLTWLFAILPPSAAWTANLLALWWVAGIGMYVFCRHNHLRPMASVCGAVSFSYCGAMVSQLPHLGLIAGTSWLPLQLLCLLRLFRASQWRSRAGWTAALGATVAMTLLAGEPRAVDIDAVVALLYGTALALRLGRRMGPFVLCAAAGAGLGLLVGAIQLLPGLAAVSTSQRSASNFDLFNSGSLFPRWLVLLVVPNALGGSGSFSSPQWLAGYNLTEVTGYAGILSLVAATSLIARLRRHRPLPSWLVWHLVALTGVVLALGGNTPLGTLLVHIPFFGAQRLQSRNIMIYDLGCSMLLAWWLELWLSDGGRLVPSGSTKRRRLVGGTLAAVPLLVVGVVVGLGLADEDGLLRWLGAVPGYQSYARGLSLWLMPFAIVALGAAALLFLAPRFLSRSHQLWFAGLFALDIVIFLVTTTVSIAPSPGNPAPAAAATSMQSVSSTAKSQLSSSVPGAGAAPISGGPLRPIDVGNGRLAVFDPDQIDNRQLAQLAVPDQNVLAGLYSVQGYSSIVDGAYAAATGSHQASGYGQNELSVASVTDGTLDQLETRVLVTLPVYASGALRQALEPPHWIFDGYDGPFVIYRNTQAAAALTWNPSTGTSVRALSGPPQAPTSASVSSASGVDVIRSVAAIPGWVATWRPNHGPALILPIRRQGVVQEVRVPAGEGVLTWSYRPPGLQSGEMASAFGVIGISGLGGWALTGRRTRKSPRSRG